MTVLKYSRMLSLLVLKPVLRANRYISNKGVLPHKTSSVAAFIVCCLILSLSLNGMLNASPLQSSLPTVDSDNVIAGDIAMNIPRIDVSSRKVADKIAFQPESLGQLDSSIIFSAFNVPHQRKKEGVFEILQYQSEMCVADFYVKQEKLSFVTFQTRDLVIAEKKTKFATDIAYKGEKRDCLQSILKDKDQTPGFFKFASADRVQKL